MNPGIGEKGEETFSWQSLVWLSDTDAWDDTQEGYHIMYELAHE